MTGSIYIGNLRGPRGIKGDTGDTGPQGIKGDTGDTGPQGVKGDTGDEGPQGSRGVKGDTGDTGPQGVKGDTGDEGPQGSRGIKGETGDPGDPGPAGPAGPKGDTGSAGATGPAGPAGSDATVTKSAVIATGVKAADLSGTPDLPDIDVIDTGKTLAVGVTSNVLAAGVYFGPDPASARPTDGSIPLRFGARASLDGSCTVTFTNVQGNLVTSTLLPGEVRVWRQASDLGFGIENAGVPLAQLDSRYSTLLVYNAGAYPIRPVIAVPYMYIGPASVAPPDAQEGDLWIYETGV